MKNTQHKIVYLLMAGIVAAGLLAGCSEWFNDPLKDKDTGEKITLFLVDFNFFDTRFTFHFEDYDTGDPIENVDIKLMLSGSDANHVVDFAGEKSSFWNTRTGRMELTYDPGQPVNESNPIEFSVYAEAQGYVPIPVFARFTQKGQKDIIVRMINTNPAASSQKSALLKSSVAATELPFNILLNGNPASQHPKLLLAKEVNAAMGSYNNIMLYHLEGIAGTTNVSSSTLANPALYSDYGFFYTSQNPAMNNLTATQAAKNQSFVSSAITLYQVVKPSGVTLCNSPMQVSFKRADNKAGGSSSFDYTLTYENGQVLKGKFSGIFPFTGYIEGLFQNMPFTLSVEGNQQYGVSPSTISVNNGCGATASVDVTQRDNLTAFQIILVALCDDNPEVGIAPSYQAQYRKTGSTGSWENFSLDGGKCTLFLELNQKYDFRLNWKGSWETYTISTNPNTINQEVDDRTTVEEFKQIDANNWRIKARYRFTQDVCNDMNW